LQERARKSRRPDTWQECINSPSRGFGRARYQRALPAPGIRVHEIPPARSARDAFDTVNGVNPPVRLAIAHYAVPFARDKTTT
jgi:hypothetical protein